MLCIVYIHRRRKREKKGGKGRDMINGVTCGYTETFCDFEKPSPLPPPSSTFILLHSVLLLFFFLKKKPSRLYRSFSPRKNFYSTATAEFSTFFIPLKTTGGKKRKEKQEFPILFPPLKSFFPLLEGEFSASGDLRESS